MPEKLFADDARKLARSYLDASHAVGKYLIDNYQQLSPEERKQLKEAKAALSDYASEFMTLAVGITLDQIQGGLAALKSATAKAKKAIGTIQKTKDLINLAAALVSLGAAIAAKNPSAISAALGALKNLLATP